MASETHAAILKSGGNYDLVARVNAGIGVVLTLTSRITGRVEQIGLTPQEMGNLIAMWESVQPDSDDDDGYVMSPPIDPGWAG